jgi:cell division protein FtsN
LGSFGWNAYNNNQYQEQLLAEQKQQDAVEQKIQQATFVIENPLPTITLNIAKEVKNYHVIAGAFRDPLNANKKVKQLISNGFDAQILGVNKWNLTTVSYASFADKDAALLNLKEIKNTVSSDAWLLVQEF